MSHISCKKAQIEWQTDGESWGEGKFQSETLPVIDTDCIHI